jgi:hypothetical protein
MANTLKFGNGQWATKVGSTLAYNDEGGNFKPLPFNFTRSTSGTRVNKDGLIEVVTNNKPRIDFLNDSNGALLLEPTRSNLIQYSEDFSNSDWNTISTRGVNFIPTSTIDPQGKTNAYRMTSTASDNQVAYLATIVLGVSYSSSIYVKRVSGSGDVILRNVNNVENNFQVSVNDGWKRLETSVLSTSTNGRLYINLQTVGDVIEIWGAQLEAGSYATSYIPTQGATATRVAETCNDAGNDQVFNGSEGVLFVEMSALANDSTTRRINLRNSSGSNQIRIEFGNSSNLISAVLFNGANQAVINNTSNNILNSNKIAFKYKENDFALWINGVEVGTDIIGTTIGAGILDRIDLSLSPNQTYSNIKQIQYFNTALTDLELQQLTTL